MFRTKKLIRERLDLSTNHAESYGNTQRNLIYMANFQECHKIANPDLPLPTHRPGKSRATENVHRLIIATSRVNSLQKKADRSDAQIIQNGLLMAI